MMPRRKISESVQRVVRQRARALCEYCHTSELWQYVRFTVDHIVPLYQGGTDDMENLCLACFHCNRRKSNKTDAFDPLTQIETPLFHPRQHDWAEHFIWSADKLYIIGLTPIGRATIEALELNRERIIRIRAADVLVHRHPPMSDAVQMK